MFKFYYNSYSLNLSKFVLSSQSTTVPHNVYSIKLFSDEEMSDPVGNLIFEIVGNQESLKYDTLIVTTKVTLICDKGTIIYFYTKINEDEMITTTENIIGFNNIKKIKINRKILPYDKMDYQLKNAKRMLILTKIF